MAVNILSIDEIVSDPAVRGGKPVIRGTGIRVADLAAWHLNGDKRSLEQLAADFRLELGQVYAAMSYYYLHQQEVDEQTRQDAAEAESLLAALQEQGKAAPITI
ncbi:MAG: DUF433 domain-containing protein [Anaerolineae bacterium]|nr:DUF433 domain-containing protein [Anaerolineae bacterium]